MDPQNQTPTEVDEIQVCRRVFDVLTQYLGDDTETPESAVESLTNFLEPDMDPQKEHCLWKTLFWMVKQIHHEDVFQDRLAEVASRVLKIHAPPGAGNVEYEDYQEEARRQSERREAGTIDDQDHEEEILRFWFGDGPFLDALNDFEYVAPLEPSRRQVEVAAHEAAQESPRMQAWAALFEVELGGPQERELGPYYGTLSGAEWANLNAFLARLLSSSTQVDLSMYTYGIPALLDALEENHSAERLDIVVPTAACWISYAGAQLKGKSFEPQDDAYFGPVCGTFWRPDDSKRNLYSVGDLWKDQGGLGLAPFNEHRWAFWSTKFRELMFRQDLKSETRELARRAWLSMF